jgi:hypothetical protein
MINKNLINSNLLLIYYNKYTILLNCLYFILFILISQFIKIIKIMKANALAFDSMNKLSYTIKNTL